MARPAGSHWRAYLFDFGVEEISGDDRRPFVVARIADNRIEVYTASPGWPTWVGSLYRAEYIAERLNREEGESCAA